MMTMYKSILKPTIHDTIQEAIHKDKVVRNGKRTVKKSTDKDGYKIATTDGKSKEVKMTPKEIRNRSKSAKITARKNKGKSAQIAKKRNKSINKRSESMILYRSSLRLNEGKQQAIAILKKGLDSYGISDKWIKLLANALEDLDPTKPKNKYIEILSKLFIKHYDGDYLIHLARAEEDDMDTALANKVVVKSITSFNSRLQDDKVPDKIESIENRNLTINLNKIKDYKDFVSTLTELASTITRSVAKLGMGGLKKNKDYIEIPLPVEDVRAYIPLYYKASKIIGSDRVGGCEGKWCTAYQKTDDYWIDYIETKGGILVYVIDDSPSIDNHANLKKTAVYFYKDFVGRENFDMNDKPIPSMDVPHSNTIEKYAKANEKKIKEALAKNFKPVDPTKMLYDAIDNGNVNGVKEAVELGANVNERFRERTQPLTTALYLWDKVGMSNKAFNDIAEYLTSKGADWNYAPNMSPLKSVPIIYFYKILKDNNLRKGNALEEWLLNTLKVEIASHHKVTIDSMLKESKTYKSKFKRIV